MGDRSTAIVQEARQLRAPKANTLSSIGLAFRCLESSCRLCLDSHGSYSCLGMRQDICLSFG